jgi:hypothetical protein
MYKIPGGWGIENSSRPLAFNGLDLVSNKYFVKIIPRS